ncbi:hypothetical protein DLH72_04955 [Candidatus Gracilibacteria bacterium]|nr:MAG: hypothetical protein DLH72_04955 [Candidatus Gracilibacteria bacterium]
MKPSEYITFSLFEKIENPKIAEILDYCEKNFDFEITSFIKEFEIQNGYKYEIKFKLLHNNLIIHIFGKKIQLYYNEKYIYKSDLDIFHSNYVGILGYLRNLK